MSFVERNILISHKDWKSIRLLKIKFEFIYKIFF